MRYSEIADIYERLEATTKKLEKRDILSDFYRSCSDSELPKSVLLSMGLVSTTEELGLAKELVKRIIAKSFGVEGKKIEEKFRELGDLGLIAEFFAKNKRQISLGKKELTISMVFENLNKLPGITGTGSQDKKILIVTELLAAATPKEAKYIVRAVLGDMRIGVAAGVVRNAIAKAFEKETKDIEKLYDVTGDFGIVAELAKKGKMKAVVMVNSPVRVMLADRAKDLKEAMDEFQEAAIEKKYDGLRLQIHKDRNSIKIFSRRLDEVTRQFPEIAEWSRDNLAAKQCIVEGEAIAIDKEGRPKPFQILSRRIQRKYDIEKTAKEIPVQVNLFDLIYFNGSFMDKPLKERWNKLKEILNETKRFRLADHIETKDIEKADRFYKESLSEGQEGVIVKNLSAPYQPGKRVGYWLKVKEILEPLDLVVTGAEWGEGKRASFLGSLLLAAKKGSDFLATGKMASGLTEEQLKDVTNKLKPLITEEEGKFVKIKPQLVIEVGYEELQKSTKYPTGYALRFPRLLRIREEKTKEDINTVKDIERLFRQQRG